MERYLEVTMPDGSIWEVPARIVAENRAAHYAEHDTKATSGPEYDRVYAEELEYTLNNPDELTDWARNNMDWADVREAARNVKEAKGADYQEGWLNGPMKVVSKG